MVDRSIRDHRANCEWIDKCFPPSDVKSAPVNEILKDGFLQLGACGYLPCGRDLSQYKQFVGYAWSTNRHKAELDIIRKEFQGSEPGNYLTVLQIRPFLKGLREYLSFRIPRYGQIIRESNTLNKETEEFLKIALMNYQKEFLRLFSFGVFTSLKFLPLVNEPMEGPSSVIIVSTSIPL